MEILRLAVALAVAGLVGRAARPAWYHRALAFAVWRRIRPVHVAGCAVLLAGVLGTAVGLMAAVPVTGWGLGRVIGIDGNAIFAPMQEAAELTGTMGDGAGAPGDPGGMIVLLTTGFLGLLLLLFPWLAYVEERIFRQGLESAGLRAEIAAAVRFGAVHLVMLIPLAAAAGIAVAGFVYGRIYRAAHRDAVGRRPGALARYDPQDVIETPARRARTEAVMAATVWHTTFNSLIVVLVLTGFVASLF